MRTNIIQYGRRPIAWNNNKKKDHIRPCRMDAACSIFAPSGINERFNCI